MRRRGPRPRWEDRAPQDVAIARRLVADGYTLTAIARALGVDRGTVARALDPAQMERTRLAEQQRRAARREARPCTDKDDKLVRLWAENPEFNPDTGGW